MSVLTFTGAFAYEYTDRYGVTWNFDTGSWDGVSGACITSVYNYGSNLVIPDSVTAGDVKYEVIRIGSNCFSNRSGIQFVKAPESVTYVDSYAFQNCYDLVNVELPGCTYLGYNTFRQCYNLIRVSIPNLRSCESYLFENCSALKEIDFSKLGQVYSYMFRECTSLEKVSLLSVHNIDSYAFQNCSSLKEVNIPVCSSINSYAFNGCTALTSISLPACTYVGESAFYGCKNLASVDMPLYPSIGSNAFFGCGGNLAYIGTSSTYTDTSNNTWGFNIYADGVGITSYNGMEFNLTIPSTIPVNGVDYPVVSLGGNVFYQNKNLTSVEIPSTVRSIGSYCFQGCENLVSINIPDAVLSIGNYAFSACRSLSSISISDDSQLKTIGYEAFYYCGMATFNMPKGVTNIGSSAFYGCYNLSSITIPDGVKVINSCTFQHCFNLTTVNISDNSLLETIGESAFSYCSQLSSFYFPVGLKQIERYAFYCSSNWYGDYGYCHEFSALSYINFSKCKDLEIIGEYAFYHSGAKSINISGCTALKSIEQYAFYQNSNLTNISLTGCTNLTSIGAYAFDNCQILSSIDIPASVTFLGSYVFHNNTYLKSVIFDSGSVLRSIGNYAFAGCNSLEDIVIPDGVGNLATNTFENCYALKAVGLPTSLTSIASHAFANCRSLEYLKLSANTKSIGSDAFLNCTNLTALDVDPANETYKSVDGVLFGKTTNELLLFPVGKSGKYTVPNFMEAIGDGVFQNCNKLTEIDATNAKKIGKNAFNGCTALKKVTFSSNLTELSDYLFRNCTALMDVVIPSSVTKTGIGVFYGCSTLKTIDIPTSLTAISDYMFYNCSVLSNITIPTSITSIGQNAFYGCASIAELTIPVSVVKIGSDAFVDCGLVKMENDVPAELSSSNLISSDSYIVVNDAALNDYRTAEFWSNMANNIVPANTYKCDTILVALPKSSALHDAIGEDNLENVVSLTLRGTINSYDMMIMRNKMPRLKNLDLKHARIISNSYEYYEGYCSQANTLTRYSIPDDISVLVLPDTLTEIGSYALYDHNKLRSIEVSSQVHSIGSYAFAECDNLQSVVMNKGLQYIQNSAFYNCQNLQNVTFPAGLYSIERAAFARCANLKNIELPEGLNYIGTGAFSGYKFSEWGDSPDDYWNGRSTMNINTVKLPSTIKSVGNYAFSNAPYLSEINFPEGLQSIGNRAFAPYWYDSYYGDGIYRDEICGERNISLKKVELPFSLTSISTEAFAYCEGLDSVILKTGLEYINDRSFYMCSSLKEVKIPETIKQIGYRAFYGCTSLNDVYAYTIQPTSINQETFSTWTTSTLHVPVASYSLYYFDTQWGQFRYIKDFEGVFHDVYVNNDYSINTNKAILTGHPDIQLSYGAGLIVEGDSIQDFATINYEHNGDVGASIIASNNLTADTLSIKHHTDANRWYFITFPYEVKRSDLGISGQSVVYTYDGATRAANGYGGWKKQNDKMTFERAKGYIFQCENYTSLDYKVANPDFDEKDYDIALNAYTSSNEQDANWNFVGNPYLSYYDINDLDYDAPLTLWTGYTYLAVRPGDDFRQLYPFQAFFVQKPDSIDHIGFKADSRITRNQALTISGSDMTPSPMAAARRARMNNSERWLVDITLTDGTSTDNTRVVFNNNSSMEYETKCDASKFMTMASAPQVYSIGNGINYSINERPIVDGIVPLGYLAPNAGSYEMAATRIDSECWIKDNETGATWNLTEGAYKFETEKGTFDNRFTLMLSRDFVTGIKDVNMTETAVTVENGKISVRNVNDTNVIIYTLSGTCIGNASTNVPAGTYIVKANNKVTKVTVK